MSDKVKPNYALDEAPKQCVSCGKPPPRYQNYCNWECHVEHARKIGGREIRPNGLPVACVTRDGDMLEHEHGDHPDYKFPVSIEYCGAEDPRKRFGSTDGSGQYIPPTDDEIAQQSSEVHALLYADESIAVTLYECCYAMWYLGRPRGRLGDHGGGSLWKNGDWKLTEESRQKIKSWVTEQRKLAPDISQT